MKIIAIGGEPGSGKSTLMKRILEKYKFEPKYTSYKLVPYLQFENIYVLGKYEESEVFSGTDRMSMAVQPEAIKFLDFLNKDSIVLFEGDRLFTSSFLEHCIDNFDTTVIYLSTKKETRTERYKERGSDQNETWLAGRETKLNNIMTNFNIMFNVEKFENNNKKDQLVVFERIVDIINDK
jgi:dephospho-CoA kinase